MADGTPVYRDDTKRLPLATEALSQLENVLNNHRNKFEQWHKNVDFSAKPRGKPLTKRHGAQQDSHSLSRRETPGAALDTGRRFEDPQVEMNKSMLQLIGYLEDSARGALISRGRNADLFPPLPRGEEDDLPGLVSQGSFPGVPGARDATDIRDSRGTRDPAAVASQIQAELGAVCKEAESLAQAFKAGPLEMPDGFREDLEALFQQNSALKDSQEKYVVDNRRLRNEVAELKRLVDEVQEGYNELHMKYMQKTRSYNYLQGLFDRQNITKEKTAFVREISLLRAENAEQAEKLSKLTKSFQDLQLESEHKLDQKSKEIAFIAKQNQELLAQHEQDVKQVANVVGKQPSGGGAEDDDLSEDVFSVVSGASSRMQDEMSFFENTLHN